MAKIETTKTRYIIDEDYIFPKQSTLIKKRDEGVHSKYNTNVHFIYEIHFICSGDSLVMRFKDKSFRDKIFKQIILEYDVIIFDNKYSC